MKTINKSGLSGKLLSFVMIAWAIMGFLPTGLSAQTEVLLGEFTFTTGTGQAKATSVQSGITMSDIYTNGQLTVDYSTDALNTSGWTNPIDLTVGRKFSFSLLKNSELLGFKITKLNLTYKRNQSVNRSMNIYYGSSYEDAGTQFSKRSNKPATYTLSVFTDTLNSYPAYVPGVCINNTAQYISIATVSGNTTEIVSFDEIEVWGYISINEKFDMYSPIAATGTPTEANKMDDIVSLSLTPGWTASNIHVFNVGYLPYANALLATSATVDAYLKTPVLDLNRPFQINFRYRSRLASDINTHGLVDIYLDENQKIWNAQTFSTSFLSAETDAFIGSENSRIKFTAPMLDGNQMIYDDIVISQSTKPALNFALQSTKALGAVTKNTQQVFNLPLKGGNLTGDVTLSLQSGANFTLSGGTTVTQANAETGTDIAVTFNAPATVGTYTDVLTISAAGTTDRVVTLSAESDLGTGTLNLSDGSVVVNGNQLMINGHAGKKATIFNLSGAALFVQDRISDSQVFTLPAKGVYLLKMEGDNAMPVTTKVMIK
jgi:hypothetical protein